MLNWCDLHCRKNAVFSDTSTFLSYYYKISLFALQTFFERGNGILDVVYAYPPHPTFHNTEPVIAGIKIYNTSVHHKKKKKLGFAAPSCLTTGIKKL